MKDTIIIYKSKYGATKQYATWLGEEMNANVVPLSKVRKKDLEQYRTIVYGGGIYAGKVAGIGKIRRYLKDMNDKRMIMFGVGTSPISQESLRVEKKSVKGSIEDKVIYFHLRGKMDYSQLSLVHSTMMKVLKKMLEKKSSPLTSSERGIVEGYGKTVDYIDKRNIQPIIRQLKKKY